MLWKEGGEGTQLEETAFVEPCYTPSVFPVNALTRMFVVRGRAGETGPPAGNGAESFTAPTPDAAGGPAVIRAGCSHPPSLFLGGLTHPGPPSLSSRRMKITGTSVTSTKLKCHTRAALSTASSVAGAALVPTALMKRLREVS